MAEHAIPATELPPLAAPQMPAMREGLLSRDDLMRLCEDIVDLTQVLSIQTRSGGNTNSDTADRSLSDSLMDLWEGRLQAVQIRYVHDGHEWTDTLLRVGSVVRVVRCQHPRQG